MKHLNKHPEQKEDFLTKNQGAARDKSASTSYKKNLEGDDRLISSLMTTVLPALPSAPKSGGPLLPPPNQPLLMAPPLMAPPMMPPAFPPPPIRRQYVDLDAPNGENLTTSLRQVISYAEDI
eukprot:TRINITY_DN1311_c1_g1_i2.p1 TRINITY_DN1311_c1_g1~~TRINITY_DN1311_c1_g1_i2.p1  ORF type:complete len:122 (+),score=34.63 TRINITY_DN1311_c1_g1_i2:198-563(+)